MDENQSSASNSDRSNKKGLAISAVAVIIILVIAGGGFLFLNKNKSGEMDENHESVNGESTKSTEDTAQLSPVPTISANSASASFKDGTYSANGSYQTPGGTEVIGVKLTVKNGIVADVTVAQLGKSPTAKVKQADFAENFKSMVVGKDLSTLNIGKVSGSSLTPNGFNDAVDQIKTQAQAQS